MKHGVKYLLIVAFFLASAGNEALAQCAMCRATLENNVSNGNIGIAAGINFGILYLFATPYIAICVIAFLWYRTSKRNAANVA
ncbi:MAG TPA: hypothetical protein VK508_02690 [Cyclobacteriaceae bacterium]|nr:hypothetical protein [Cyclobacteriaceae bacterium]